MKAKDDEGKTALDYVRMNIKRMGAQASKLLAEKTGLSPTEELLVIIGKAKPDKVRQLIQDGADVKAQSKEGLTLLIAAALQDTNPEVLGVLLEAGADVNAKNKDGLTPLMITVGNNSNLEALGVLIEAGADVNAKNKDGATPLMFAAIKNTSEVLKVLLEAGADVNAKSTARLSS